MTTLPKELPHAALVTGGAKRLGAALALALAEDGFDVALHYHRSKDAAEATARTIEGLGRRCALLPADLTDADATLGLVPEARMALGPPGVLVNCAALFANDRVKTLEPAKLDAQIAVNLKAPLLLASAFAKALPEGAHGLIVNLLDQRLVNPTRAYLSYTVAKAGLHAATQVLARDLAPNVRVAAIGPGQVLPAPGMSDDRFKELVAKTPLKVASGVEEIIAAFRLILHSPSITGQMLLVDSGMHMGWAWP